MLTIAMDPHPSLISNMYPLMHHSYKTGILYALLPEYKGRDYRPHWEILIGCYRLGHLNSVADIGGNDCW